VRVFQQGGTLPIGTAYVSITVNNSSATPTPAPATPTPHPVCRRRRLGPRRHQRQPLAYRPPPRRLDPNTSPRCHRAPRCPSVHNARL
jgi:hypothetical protein